MKHQIFYNHMINAYDVGECKTIEKVEIDKRNIENFRCYHTRKCPNCGNELYVCETTTFYDRFNFGIN